MKGKGPWMDGRMDVIFAEPRDIRKHPCSLVDLNVAGIAGLFGNKMLRPEAAPQEVDNCAEVVSGFPGFGL